MKKLAFAGLAAVLTLTALSGQRASAQCCPPDCRRGGEISFNLGLTFGVHWTPCHGHWAPNCPPPCYGSYGYGPPPYAYAPPGYGGPFAPLPAASANGPAVPNAPAAPTTSTAANGVQIVGYSYPAAYGYDYSYLYGYGYPSYQAPDYWYGR